jgi:hypothetical protein
MLTCRASRIELDLFHFVLCDQIDTREETKIRCSIIVLNYNGRLLLDDCLRSIEKQSYTNFETILVDNNSTDDSVDYVSKYYPSIRVIKNSKNDGTAGGFNFGAQCANGEYLLFLCNDISIETDIVEKMLGAIESNDEISICGAKNLSFWEHDKIDNVGHTIDIFGFPHPRGSGQKDRGQFDNQRGVCAVSGTCLMISKSLFRDLGGFDPSYFTLVDEIDLCWRARLWGYKVYVAINAKMYHKVSVTLRKLNRGKLRYLSERNTLRTLIKNYSGRTLAKILPPYFGIIFMEISFYLSLTKVNLAAALVRSIFWNIFHFPDTWRLRMYVQSKRKVSDSSLKRDMINSSLKINMLRTWMKGGIAV